MNASVIEKGEFITYLHAINLISIYAIYLGGLRYLSFDLSRDKYIVTENLPAIYLSINRV